MAEILLLVTALAFDTFVASIGYGGDGIRIPWKMAVLLNLICSSTLALALGAGSGLGALLPERLTNRICCVSFLFLGMIKLSDYLIKRSINRHCGVDRKITFSLSRLMVVVRIYGDPREADLDSSKDLSWKETVFLALAMSVDGVAAGTFAALMGIPVGLTAAAAFGMGMAAMYGGYFIGKGLSGRKKHDLSFLGGVLFLILGAVRLGG